MKSRVLLWNCDGYDPNRIASIIGRGMDVLGVRPKGRTMVKPNTVVAHHRFYPYSFTRPEFVEGLLIALRERGDEISELSIGERCGITIPTRFAVAEAGYVPIARKHGARIYYFEEYPQVRWQLRHPDALRPFIFVPEPVINCEFLVNAPKLKAHPWTKMTCALKNYMGLQDSDHRVIDHDYNLHTKIVDLQEIISPGLIAVDAITAGELTMMTPRPRDLNLIIMGTNQVAVDTVAAHILGLDPREVDHIRIAAGRGIGPIDLDEIEIGGDLTLDEAIRRAEGFELSMLKVDEAFNGKSNLHCYVGPPPDPEGTDYCWGGCPGALYETMESLARSWQPNVYHEVKPLHYVFGRYEGPIEAKPGERVIFVGDCATYEGEILGHKVKIRSYYTPRDKIDPRYYSSHLDLVLKILTWAWTQVKYLGKPYVRIRGCPVTMAEHHLYLAFSGGTVNPYFEPSLVFSFMYHYLISHLARFWRTKVLRLFRRHRRKVPDETQAEA